MAGRDFPPFMEAFLRFADQSWGNLYDLGWSLGMFTLPIVALELLWDNGPRSLASSLPPASHR